MFDNFKEYLLGKADFSAADLKKVKAVCQERTVAKNEFLLQEGDLWGHNAFVCSGLMRTYTVDSQGNEQTILFSPQNYWTGDRISLLTGKPTEVNVQAVEDTQLLLITHNDFRELIKKINAFNTMATNLIQKNLVVTQKYISEIISLSDKEKYDNFLVKYPTIIDRIPLSMVASYIGITPETLTRIINSTK